MSLVLPREEYYALDIPAIVQNDNKLIQMLGGAEEILHVFDGDKRRLRLNFRPHMLYAKPACGDAVKSGGLILSVKQYRNHVTGETMIVPAIIGRVTRTYKFDSMVDFQFGPFERIFSNQQQQNASPPTSSAIEKHRVFYKDLLIREPSTSLDPCLMRDVPLYLPPVLFSRHDHPIVYDFNSRYRSSEYINLEEKIQMHPTARKSRTNYSCVISMDDPTPLTPHPMNAELVKEDDRAYVQMKELFQKRPIWVRSALAYHVKVRPHSFKPAVFEAGYYMIGGPWGRTWIRFGYDPRQDPESRYYQVIDFRIKSHIWVSKILKLERRSHGVLLSTQRKRSIKRTNEQCVWIGSTSVADDMLSSTNRLPPAKQETMDGEQEEEEAGEEDGESGAQFSQASKYDFRFSPDHLPRSQQIMICLVDIDIPEVQLLLSKKPMRVCCDPIDGWLDPGVLGRIRQLMNKHLQLWLGEVDCEPACT